MATIVVKFSPSKGRIVSHRLVIDSGVKTSLEAEVSYRDKLNQPSWRTINLGSKANERILSLALFKALGIINRTEAVIEIDLGYVELPNG